MALFSYIETFRKLIFRKIKNAFDEIVIFAKKKPSKKDLNDNTKERAGNNLADLTFHLGRSPKVFS